MNDGIPVIDRAVLGERKVESFAVIFFSYFLVYVCMVIKYSRVCINRVRLPILLVVS